MKNKIVLITGGNSGIGKATAMGLAKLGATVVIACRNKEKGQQAVIDIKNVSGNQDIELLVVDLASQKSVRAAAMEFKSRYKQLHVLINNAAVFLRNREETEDGLEKTFATNYLSHFLLTHLLLDLLKKSAPSRIINVASKHFGIKINFDDLQTTKNYSFMKAVGPTKLGMILFTKKLARELEGSGVTVNSLHPGLAKSNLLNEIPAITRFLFNLMMSSPEKCAETCIYLASSRDLDKTSGLYYEKCKPVPTGSNANSEDDINMLWEISMKLCNPVI
jgi:NAD(P)-dependent dehydrogenase (short-subunit alcohol dehydrogenase family)